MKYLQKNIVESGNQHFATARHRPQIQPASQVCLKIETTTPEYFSPKCRRQKAANIQIHLLDIEGAAAGLSGRVVIVNLCHLAFCASLRIPFSTLQTKSRPKHQCIQVCTDTPHLPDSATAFMIFSDSMLAKHDMQTLLSQPYMSA